MARHENLTVGQLELCSSHTETFAIASFTDNTNTTGYKDFARQLPKNSLVIGWKAVVSTGFTGDTSATVIVGISGDTDAFSSVTTNSCYAAGTVGCGAGAASTNQFCAAATTPRVTVTGNADFTSITAGSMKITLYYVTLD
jgi:hypothetical protein